MIHNIAHVNDDMLFTIGPDSGSKHIEHIVCVLLDTMQLGHGLPVFHVEFCTGRIGTRNLEKADPWMTFAETRVLMQFRKTLLALQKAWGSGAAKHRTQTVVYQNFNSSVSLVIVFLGWTDEGGRRTATSREVVEAVLPTYRVTW